MKIFVIFLILTTIFAANCSKSEPEPVFTERIQDHFWAIPHYEIITMGAQAVHHKVDFPKHYSLDEYEVKFFLFGDCVLSLQSKISNENSVWISVQGTRPDLFHIGETIDFEWSETATIKGIDTAKRKVHFMMTPFKERSFSLEEAADNKGGGR